VMDWLDIALLCASGLVIAFVAIPGVNVYV
jgi:hypothetical protein